MTTDDVNKQTPQEFFETIGNKVKNLAPTADGEQNDDDERAVEEIESLCMNCGKNVSRNLESCAKIRH
jgi:zinc finger protein